MAAADSPAPLPNQIEDRLAEVTEMVATAISNTESRARLGRLAEEQAALRRVATLVARGVPPEEAFPQASAEAQAAFGDGGMFVEKCIQRPRHVEVQVMADDHGSVVHLFERERAIQRRKQKLIEEAPSPSISGYPRAPLRVRRRGRPRGRLRERGGRSSSCSTSTGRRTTSSRSTHASRSSTV
jgi:hypothetical protein